MAPEEADEGGQIDLFPLLAVITIATDGVANGGTIVFGRRTWRAILAYEDTGNEKVFLSIDDSMDDGTGKGNDSSVSNW